MRRRAALFTLAAGCAWAARVLAETEETAPAHAAPSPLWPVLFSTINLLIFLWVLARYVLPPVRELVRGRHRHIVQALEQAATAKADALRLRNESEQRLAQFPQAVTEMQAQARRDAAREHARALEAARKTADTIRRDAEMAAAYEVRRTQEQLRAELVRQAVRLAEEAARTQLSADDHRRFISDFLQQVRQ